MIVCYIDGERMVVDPDNIDTNGYSDIVEIITQTGQEFYLAESSGSAGAAAKEYWEDLAQQDPDEFAALIGPDTLVKWGLGQMAGPGSTSVSSLPEWLDIWLDYPEEQWASYDSRERKFNCKHPDLALYKVAYRSR